MTLHRFTTLPCLILTLLASACDLGDKSIGNETGADNGDGDGDGDGDETEGDGDGELPSDGGCGEETVTIIDDPQASLPGFDGVAADYIALAAGGYLGEFAWGNNDGPLTMAHADSTSPLTIGVGYEGGELRLTEVEHLGEYPDGNLGGPPCSNVLEFDVVVQFATDDGLFAESFAVPIRVDSHGEPPAPGFYFSLDLEQLDGDLSIDDFTYEGADIEGFVLMGTFAEDGVLGSLGMEIRTMDWVGFGLIAEFSGNRLP